MKKKIDIVYYFKKVRGKVYKFQKIGNKAWEKIETVYKDEPFVYWLNE